MLEDLFEDILILYKGNDLHAPLTL